MKKVVLGALSYVLGFVIGLAIFTLVWGGIVWVACWLLKSIGIATIGSWTIAFSWKLTFLVALICKILESIFGQKKNN